MPSDRELLERTAAAVCSADWATLIEVAQAGGQWTGSLDLCDYQHAGHEENARYVYPERFRLIHFALLAALQGTPDAQP